MTLHNNRGILVALAAMLAGARFSAFDGDIQ